jgi:hypothetical protein
MIFSRMLRASTLLLMLFLVLPLAFSLECSNFDGEDFNSCNSINNAELSPEEKNSLISNMLYSSSYLPNHDLIYDWNTKLQIEQHENAVLYNNGFIKNAWLKILAVMPSVLENESLYAPSDAKLLTAYNYKVEVPKNYYSSGYPKTNKGDCKRIYSKPDVNALLYVNNKLAEKLNPLAISRDSEIKARLSITANTKIEHYRWRRYCCARNENGCTRYCSKCVLRDREDKQDRVNIEDSINVKHYDKEQDADLTVINSYNGNIKVNLDFPDSVDADFGDSQYKFYKYFYDVVSDGYTLTLRAKQIDNEKIKNIFQDNESLILKKPDDCRIKFWNHFFSKEESCDLDYEKIGLLIETDKLSYKTDEKISVNIFPSDIPVELSYGEQKKTVKAKAEFTAEQFANKITARYNYEQAERLINVGKERLALVRNLSIFSFFNYFLFAVIKKFSFKFI